MKRMFLSAGCLVCAVALGSAPALAQQKQPKTPPKSQESPVFGETIDVRVVNVEVVVTDRDGNRVTGLKPGDFRLKVDGKEVPVTYFSEIAGGQSVAAPPAGAAAERAPATSGVGDTWRAPPSRRN